MPSPNASTWDLVPPRRPGVDDFNGCAKMDDAEFPPDPETMPSAAEWNTKGLLLVALGKVVPNARISVHFANGAPTLASFTAAPNAVTVTTLSVARTAGGSLAGDVSITWPAGTFPEPLTQPSEMGVNVDGPPAAWAISATNIPNGIRVLTTVAVTATDLPFTVGVP